jgi:hypothetical protein
MKRTALLSLVVLTLALGVPAEAGNRGEVQLKPGGLVGFRGIECKATVTTYPVLTCVNGKYEVAVSRDRVIVVRGRDGHVIFHTPY